MLVLEFGSMELLLPGLFLSIQGLFHGLCLERGVGCFMTGPLKNKWIKYEWDEGV